MDAYPSNTMVTVTAVADSGWQFLGWAGDLDGMKSPNIVTMNRDKCVVATFGTRLDATTAGTGSVALNPPGGLYPYGTIVSLYALPGPTNYLVLWGNAGSGTNNPLSYTVNNANPSISAAFGNLATNQVSLAVFPEGGGSVSVSPAGNRFSNGQLVSILASAGPGQTFLGWSGDAAGVENPLFLVLNGSKSVQAHFSKIPSLQAGPCFGGWSETGFRLTLNGDWGSRYTLERSSNLQDWIPVLDVTNSFGSSHVVDVSATNQTLRAYRAVLPR
jgi:hypothetical protein